MECNDLEKLSAQARDHGTNPRNYGPLGEFDGHARITGPCGDTMEFWVAAREGRVTRASFVTDGCYASLACGSVATALAGDRRIEDAAALGQRDILAGLGGLPPEFEHCALLAADTLRAACEDCLNAREEKPAGAGEGKRTCGACGDGDCLASGHGKEKGAGDSDEERRLRSRLSRIRRKIVVLSGKGGVGKSTVAVNLAMALMMSGKRVGLLDVDIHGPSIPTMLGLEGEEIRACEDGLLPVDLGDLKVMSLGFLLRNPDDAVIWRGPVKMAVIRQFLTDVVWGDLDFLIIDSPPGTGDEPLSVCQLIGALDGAVIVTTPQKVAAVDVRKSVTFCRRLHVPVLGVVENMSGFTCPKCGEITRILPSGGGERIAADMGVPFLGAVPMDPGIAQACDGGRVFIEQYAASPAAAVMRNVAAPIAALEGTGRPGTPSESDKSKEDGNMRIAIPLANGKLCMHFGHCERFALVDADPDRGKIVGREDVEAPPHEPGLLPRWLAERGAAVIIAGGMGRRAQELFAQRNIRVIVGAPAETPENLAAAFLAGTLRSGVNVCDH
jgi:Mrp family chromosome partitioning ATPase/predicted Fe-Mo cluster-binding NifX family protein